jgi:hypothetical protein
MRSPRAYRLLEMYLFHVPTLHTRALPVVAAPSRELRAPATNSPLLDPFFLVLFAKRREASADCRRTWIDMRGGRRERRQWRTQDIISCGAKQNHKTSR